MSDNEATIPTEGLDYGHTIVVWPSKGELPAGNPAGNSLSPGLSLGPGWQDWSTDGFATPQGLTVWMIPQRLTLDQTVEDGDWPGWSMMLYQGTWEQHPISAAREALDQGLSSGLPEPSRPAVIPFARLDPDSVLTEGISRAVTFLPLDAVTDVPASALPPEPEKVNVQRRVTDMVKDGKQYLVLMGGNTMTVPVVDAKPVKDRTPGADRFLKGTWQATVAPGLPNLVFTSNLLERPLGFPHGYKPNTDGIILEQGAYGTAGYTAASHNGDVIVRFPADSNIQPLYVSAVEFTGADELKQRQDTEDKIKAEIAAKAEAAAKAEEEARAKAEAEARAKAEAEAKAKAEAEAKAKAEAEAKARDELFVKAGVTPAPAYTPEMVKAAEAALGATGVMALSQAPNTMQLSVAGNGVWTAAGEAVGGLSAAIGRGLAALTASTVGPMVAAASTIFFSPPAGGGSDKVPGRDLDAMFALNAQLLAGQGGNIEPGATSVNLPVRGQLVNSNGQMAMQLLKTGEGLPAAVPVLNAVRDAATGLDKITVPAVAGALSRTILVNPAPPPAQPSDTGNQQPVPVTPVHTGTEVKPVENITVTTTPADIIGGLQDFIYWRPDAAGTGVEPVYVMLSGPYGETNAKGKYSGRDYNTDKAGGPIQDLDWKTTTIDRAGVDKVKLHTGRFGESPDNVVMIDRLEKILKGELQPTDTDKRFYTHEIRELERYRAVGVPDGVAPDDDGATWNNTHTATLEDYKLSSDRSLLYTPEALKAGDE